MQELFGAGVVDDGVGVAGAGGDDGGGGERVVGQLGEGLHGRGVERERGAFGEAVHVAGADDEAAALDGAHGDEGVARDVGRAEDDAVAAALALRHLVAIVGVDPGGDGLVQRGVARAGREAPQRVDEVPGEGAVVGGLVAEVVDVLLGELAVAAGGEQGVGQAAGAGTERGGGVDDLGVEAGGGHALVGLGEADLGRLRVGVAGARARVAAVEDDGDVFAAAVGEQREQRGDGGVGDAEDAVGAGVVGDERLDEPGRRGVERVEHVGAVAAEVEHELVAGADGVVVDEVRPECADDRVAGRVVVGEQTDVLGGGGEAVDEQAVDRGGVVDAAVEVGLSGEAVDADDEREEAGGVGHGGVLGCGRRAQCFSGAVAGESPDRGGSPGVRAAGRGRTRAAGRAPGAGRGAGCRRRGSSSGCCGCRTSTAAWCGR
ncbi:MAG: hypothetical protein R3F65_18025 [bacterium]